MINIIDLEIEKNIKPIWRLAFRPFFLGGSLFSLIAMVVWVLTLNGTISFSPYAGAVFWHAHEMVFGFVVAIIIGFLLTASQTWTGRRSVSNKSLMLMFCLWLVARILISFAPIEWATLTMIVDLSLYVVAGVHLLKQILSAKNYRNLFVVPILLLLGIANGLTHYSFISQNAIYYVWGKQLALMLVIMLMTVIGGRVIPMFTANGTNTKKVVPKQILEITVLFSIGILLIISITNTSEQISSNVMAWLYCSGAVLSAVRAIRWRPWLTLQAPIVWSLHAAYWFIPIGLLLYALHYWGFAISTSNASHSITAGAMGSLILAMITRVSLGHTGRKLVLHPIIKYAYCSVIIAALIRVFAGILVPSYTMASYELSASLWIFSYCCFVVCYWRILSAERVDGHLG